MEPASQSEELLDVQLLDAVGRVRDSEALARFFERHQSSAYNFSLRLTHSAEEAEEVLQEALLVVWKRAATFRGEGSARSWFFKIIALKALQQMRGQRRAVRRVQIVAGRQARRDDLATEEMGWQDQGERVSLLREALAELSELDRRLVALHFGGQLRIAEIARCCEIPRQTVMARLERALASLRSRLSQAGLNATPALLGAELLRLVLGGGAPVPPELGARVLGKALAQGKALEAGKSLSSGSLLVGGGLLAVTLAGVCLAWSLSSPSRSGIPASPPAWSASTALPGQGGPTEALASAGGFAHYFSFARAQHVRFPLLRGTWNWMPSIDGGSGALVVRPREELHCLLPLQVPAQPLLLEVKLRAPQHWSSPGVRTIRWAMGVLWAQGQSIPAHTLYKNPELLLRASRYRFQAYLFDRYVIGRFEPDWVFYVQEYERPYPGERLYLELLDWVVDEIGIRALAREELPDQLKDPQALIRQLNFPPMSKRPEPFAPAAPEEGPRSPETPDS